VHLGSCQFETTTGIRAKSVILVPYLPHTERQLPGLAVHIHSPYLVVITRKQHVGGDVNGPILFTPVRENSDFRLVFNWLPVTIAQGLHSEKEIHVAMHFRARYGRYCKRQECEQCNHS